MVKKRVKEKEQLEFSAAISYEEHVLRIIGNTCKAEKQDEKTLLNDETVKKFFHALNELRNIKSTKKSVGKARMYTPVRLGSRAKPTSQLGVNGNIKSKKKLVGGSAGQAHGGFLCEGREIGCQFTGTRDAVAEHERDCPFIPWHCENKWLGCPKIGTQTEVESHEITPAAEGGCGRAYYNVGPPSDFKDLIHSIETVSGRHEALRLFIDQFRERFIDRQGDILERPPISKTFHFNGNEVPNELTFLTAFLWSEQDLTCDLVDGLPSLFKLITSAYRNNNREILSLLEPFLLQLHVCVIGCSSIAEVHLADIYRGEPAIYNLNDIRSPELTMNPIRINDITFEVEGGERRLKPEITTGYEGVLTSFSACSPDVNQAHEFSIDKILDDTVSVIYTIRGVKECFSFNLTPLNSFRETELLLLPGLRYRVTDINYVRKANRGARDCHVLEITIEITGISREFLGIPDTGHYTNILREIRVYMNGEFPLLMREDDIDDMILQLQSELRFPAGAGAGAGAGNAALQRRIVETEATQVLLESMGENTERLDLEIAQMRSMMEQGGGGGTEKNIVRDMIYLVMSEMLPETREKRVFEIGVEHLLKHLNIEFSSHKTSDLEPEYMVKVNKFWESLIEVIKLMKPTFMGGGKNKKKSKRKSKRSRRDKRTKKTRRRRSRKLKKGKKTKRRRNKIK